MVHLVQRLKSDVEAAPFPEEQKKILRGQIAPFLPLLSFTQFNITLKQAKSSWLGVPPVSGLLSVEMALSAHSPILELDAKTNEAIEELRGLRDQVHALNIPEHFKEVLLKRLAQVLAGLDHYYQFGPKELNAHIEGLMGQLVIQGTMVDDEVRPFYKEITGATGAVYKGIEKVNRFFSQSGKLIENGGDVLELLQRASDKIS